MPIRFRCRYCNQLMGISRRKAGEKVHCPTCHAEVLVPPPDGEEHTEAPPPQPAGEVHAPLFERSDFEAFLQNPVNESPPPRVANPPAPLPPSSALVSLSPGVLPRRPAGLVLSPTQATWLTVGAILLLALAFGAGLLVGHYWMG
jgi:phage FluMu protein Com